MDFNEIWNEVVEWFNSEWETLVWGLCILIFGLVIIHIIRKIIKKVLFKCKVETLGRRFVERVIAVVLYVVYIMLLLQAIGVPISGMLALFSAAALAIALALKDNISNLASGVLIIFNKPFKQNETILFNGDLCRVREIRLLTTLLDTFDNRRLIVPNNELTTKPIDNLSTNGSRRVSVKFHVSHTTDLDTLRTVCMQTMQSYPGIFTDPEPILVLNEIDKDGVHFDARCWCKSADYCDTLFGLTENIYNELKRNKITFASRRIDVAQKNNREIMPVNSPVYIKNSVKSPPAKLDNLDEIGPDGLIPGTLKGKKQKRKLKKAALKNQESPQDKENE